MSFLILLPLLLLIVPANVNSILLFFITYLVVSFYLKKEIVVRKGKFIDKRRLLSSVLVGMVLSMFFYVRWLNFSVLNSISQRIGISISIITIVMAMVIVILSLPAIYKLIELIENKIYNSNNFEIHSTLVNNNINSKSAAILSIIMIIVFWILQGKLSLYADLDNYQNSMILNGMFSEDNYGNFVSPILAFLVKVIDSIIPNLDGYTFIMEMSILLALWLLIFTLFSICKNKISVFIIWFALIGVNYNVNILHANFTIISAVLSCCSLFTLYAFAKKKVGIPVGILGFVVFFIGGLFRINSQLLFIPFVCLILLSDLVASDKDKTLKYLKRVIPIFVVVALCLSSNFLVDKAVASSSKYKEAVTFSNNRSNLFDYETKSYEQVSKQLSELGVSKNDYKAVKQSLLADTDIVTSEYLENINDIVKMNINSNTVNDLVETINNSVTEFQIIAIEFFVYFAFLIYLICLKKVNKFRIVELLLSIVGSVIIISYFYLGVGRLPWYLTVAILMCNWLVLLSAFVSCDESEKYNFNRNNIVIVYSLLILSIAYAIFGSLGADTSNNSKVLDVVNAKPTVNFTDSVNHNKYVWETSSYNKYIKKTFYSQNTLPSSKFICNNIPDKKSFYGQVYYNDYLQNIGMKNPVKSLLNKNAFYVCEKSNLDLMFNFIKEHYDSSIKVKQVDKISNIPVWKFIR